MSVHGQNVSPLPKDSMSVTLSVLVLCQSWQHKSFHFEQKIYRSMYFQEQMYFVVQWIII